jgi:hypothetical protein
MRYVLLIYGDERAATTASAEDRKAMFDAYAEYTKWLADKGWMQAGDPLHGTDQATTVRVKGDETVTTDGPFAETKEQLGGYYVVDCPSLDEAIEAAARCPGARYGSMEVRPIMEMEDVPRP